jgi:hypothetical protein
MKKLYSHIKNTFGNKRSKQQDILNFIFDEKNIAHAAEGSMQKRLNLIKRVEMRKKNA